VKVVTSYCKLVPVVKLDKDTGKALKIEPLDSDPHSFEMLDPDQHLSIKPNPDLQKINAFRQPY